MAVWQSLTLLEEGLTHSPSNAQFKLLLIRIYCMLGAFEPVVELYSSLDAKHIQHDTIGWVVYAQNNCSHWLSANQAQHFKMFYFPFPLELQTSNMLLKGSLQAGRVSSGLPPYEMDKMSTMQFTLKRGREVC